MRTEEIGKHVMRRELVTFVLCTQMVEVGMVGALQQLGCDDSRHKECIGGCGARRLDPNGGVDGDVEEKAEKPVGNGHCALAG